MQIPVSDTNSVIQAQSNPVRVLKRAGDKPAPEKKTIPTETLILNENLNKKHTPETENKNVKITTRIKQILLPQITEAIGVGKDLGKAVADIDNYQIVKDVTRAIGFGEKNSERIASNFSDREFNRFLARTGIHIAEALPQKYIERSVKNEIVKTVISSIPQSITKSAQITSLETALTINKGIIEAESKAISKLTEKGIVKTVPVTFIKSPGFVKNIRADGIRSGLCTTLTERISEVKRAIKPEIPLKAAEGTIPERIMQATKNNFVKSGEKVLDKGIKIGSEKAVQEIVQKGVITVSGKGQQKVLQKSVTLAAEKAIVKSAEKTGVTIASKFAKVLPVIGTAAEGYIMYKDLSLAIEIHNDPKASAMSSLFADATVILDAVSLVSTATGIAPAKGLVASGLSIVTSIVSNATRD